MPPLLYGILGMLAAACALVILLRMLRREHFDEYEDAGRPGSEGA